MATQREVKNRIKSIKNTLKITSTMEMISAAKMKKIQQRLEMSKPYEIKLNEILSNLMATGIAASHDPHFRDVDNPTKVMVLQITGNRGLCGSFNNNVIETTLSFKEKLAEEDKETLLYVVGKKGISVLNYMKEPMYKSVMNLEDEFAFEDAVLLGNELRKLFLSREVDEVYISYTKAVSYSLQRPVIVRLFPIPPEEKGIKDLIPEEEVEYDFEPDANMIFSYIIPLYMKVKIFVCFLESSFSEQFARRVAMKNATDASADMIKELTITYNRARQAKITNEIVEIVGGAAVLE